ncbi:hypothetical protein HanPI659440_Chr10g0375041 [Helianthus annuus]|nr:hypothetical protein HanPI659440_Chr10g0375041 [Helianthus annuus]
MPDFVAQSTSKVFSLIKHLTHNETRYNISQPFIIGQNSPNCL